MSTTVFAFVLIHTICILLCPRYVVGFHRIDRVHQSATSTNVAAVFTVFGYSESSHGLRVEMNKPYNTDSAVKYICVLASSNGVVVRPKM